MLALWRNSQFFSSPKWLTNLWHNWLKRRLPPNEKMTLSHKSIFILPSRFGLIWILLVILLYLFGTNYQNNLIIGLSLLLLSLFNTCLIFGYKNLAGLSLQRLPTPHAYAGETLNFPCEVHNANTSQQVDFFFRSQRRNAQLRVSTSIINNKTTTISIPFEFPHRGRVNPGRITIESRFPLGLCRAWSHVDLNHDLIVFAKHLSTNIKLSGDDIDNDIGDAQGTPLSGVDEFKGLKPHIPGESLKQVAWKQLAQGRGMLSKEFYQPQGSPLWLTLENQTAQDMEGKISQLAWQIDKLHQQGQAYGLKLPNQSLSPNNSEPHRISCQQAIALLPNDKSAKVNAHG